MTVEALRRFRQSLTFIEEGARKTSRTLIQLIHDFYSLGTQSQWVCPWLDDRGRYLLHMYPAKS